MNAFQEALGPLYPELGANRPDPDVYAESVIVRVLNTGPDSLREQWKLRLQLPDRSPALERIHRLWRQ
jgi:hypothetical protein